MRTVKQGKTELGDDKTELGDDNQLSDHIAWAPDSVVSDVTS